MKRTFYQPSKLGGGGGGGGMPDVNIGNDGGWGMSTIIEHYSLENISNTNLQRRREAAGRPSAVEAVEVEAVEALIRQGVVAGLQEA